MTELPRYIGRHASPEAAAPSTGDPSPEDSSAIEDGAAVAEPAMPRLEFEPSVADEPTAIIDPSTEAALPEPSEAAPRPEPAPSPNPSSSADRWGDRGRAASPPPGPQPPSPEALRPGPPGLAGLPLRATPDEPASAGPDPEDPWTAQAPDIAPGPAPEGVADPEAAAESADRAEPESVAEADAPPEPEPADRPAPEPLAEVPPALEPEPEPELPPDPEPEPAAEADPTPPDSATPAEYPEPEPPPEPPIEPDPQPEAERDMPLRPEPDWTPTPAFAASAPSASRPVAVVPEVGTDHVDTHGLARMALLDAVRDVWPGGTPDLSAWLASNLELLADPLGFALTPRHHVPALSDGALGDGDEVDQSPLDISGNLLTADLAGAPVAVRAQVGQADTDGLGALLSAAAAAKAQTAVWVCPRIDASLRQTLRWVGGDPSANIRLYGLEMYLVQIAGSPTAPLFDAVVSP